MNVKLLFLVTVRIVKMLKGNETSRKSRQMWKETKGGEGERVMATIWKKNRARERECVRACVCARKWERECACVRESERECVCVRERWVECGKWSSEELFLAAVFFGAHQRRDVFGGVERKFHENQNNFLQRKTSNIKQRQFLLLSFILLKMYWQYLAYDSSPVDWCEPNYVYSANIAEFYNTISNAFFIILPPILIYLHWPYAIVTGPGKLLYFVTNDKIYKLWIPESGTYCNNICKKKYCLHMNSI